MKNFITLLSLLLVPLFAVGQSYPSPTFNVVNASQWNGSRQTGAGLSGNLVGSQSFIWLNDTSANNVNNGYYVGFAANSQSSVNDNGVVTTLAATEAVNATTLQLTSTTGFVAGQQIYVMLDNGNPQSEQVQSVSSPNITVSVGLTDQASSGNSVFNNKGAVQGGIANGILTSTATAMFGVEGFEANLSTRTGSSVFFKCVLCAVPNSDDVVAASGPWDIGIGISAQNGAAVRKAGLAFGPFAGSQPLGTGSVAIQSFGAAILNSLIDLSSYSCSGGYALRFSNYTIDCVGNATGLRISHSLEERDLTLTYNQPTTGGTVAMATNTETALIDPAGTLATLTITLPPCAFTTNGYIARYSTTQTITALTVGTTGSIGTVNNAPTTLAAGTGNEYICRGFNGAYYRLY